VKRQFRAPAPNRLIVADFTYVRMATGCFAYTAFAIDAFANRIVGWECATSKHTSFVETAVRQDVVLRRQEGRTIVGPTIHHSDAGSPSTRRSTSAKPFTCKGSCPRSGPSATPS
jgi:putative transposase